MDTIRSGTELGDGHIRSYLRHLKDTRECMEPALMSVLPCILITEKKGCHADGKIYALRARGVGSTYAFKEIKDFGMRVTYIVQITDKEFESMKELPRIWPNQ